MLDVKDYFLDMSLPFSIGFSMAMLDDQRVESVLDT